jgi:MFS transporter, DHA2 family, multidrug resistance protein
LTAAARHRGPITVCVMLATIMQALDMTIANVALPYMQGTLSATLDQINWVLTSYIIAAAIMTPPTGWLAARFGRKRVFLFTVAGFTAASVLCGMAQTLEQMVVFRLLQGMFGAPLVPLSQSVLLDAYPRERHGSAMAIWGMGVMVGPILGPTLGGWLTEFYNWRWVFYINLPVGILTLAGLAAFLSETKEDRSLRFDWFGFGTLSLAVGSFQMMLDRGERLDWFDSTEVVFEAALSGLCLYLFLVHTFTAERRPFIDPEMFRDRNFSAGLVLIFVVGIVLIATMALMAPYIQTLMHYPVLTAGVLLAPRGVGTMLVLPLVGRLVGRIDPRWLLLSGFSIVAYSLWEMTHFTPDISSADILRTGFVQGIGLGLTFVPLTTMTFATLPPRHRANGTALFSLLRNLGASVGVSVLIFLLGRNTQVMHAALAENVTPFNDLFRLPSVAAFWNLGTEAGRLALDAELTRQAAAIAYVNDFKLMMAVVLCAIPLIFLLRRPPPGRGVAATID